MVWRAPYLPPVQEDGGLAHKDKVILYAPPLGEGALVTPDQLRHPRGEPQGQQFRHELGERMYQANGAELLQLNRAIHLWQQRKIRSVQIPKTLIPAHEHRMHRRAESK
jgi:hypothetical protein